MSSSMMLTFVALLIHNTLAVEMRSGEAPVRRVMQEVAGAGSVVPVRQKQRGTLPTQGRIAVLIRGESFRCQACNKMDRHSCMTEETMQCGGVVQKVAIREIQLNATRTFKLNVIAPLEDLGNQVDVFYSDNNCSMQSEIFDVLGKNLKGHMLASQGGQGSHNLESLNFFSATVQATGSAVERYDLFLMVRVDQVFIQPIDRWPADWSLFNFLQRCERGADEMYGGPGGLCVSDVLYAMPGKAYKAFHDLLADAKENVWNICHHHCYKNMKAAMRAVGFGVGFAIDYLPQRSIREGNPYAPLYDTCVKEEFDAFFNKWANYKG